MVTLALGAFALALVLLILVAVVHAEMTAHFPQKPDPFAGPREPLPIFEELEEEDHRESCVRCKALTLERRALIVGSTNEELNATVPCCSKHVVRILVEEAVDTPEGRLPKAEPVVDEHGPTYAIRYQVESREN